MMVAQPTETTRSPAVLKAAIRETRLRLAENVALTVEHVRVVLTPPGSETEAPAGRAVAGALRTIAAAGHAKRLWADAKRLGLLRRVALGAGAVVIGAALVTLTRRR